MRRDLRIEVKSMISHLQICIPNIFFFTFSFTPRLPCPAVHLGALERIKKKGKKENARTVHHSASARFFDPEIRGQNKKMKLRPRKETIKEEREDTFFNTRTATGLAVLSLFYVALLYVEVSFVIVTVVFLVVSLYMFGERNPIWLIGYSAGFTLVIWAVFINWLNVPLP